MKGVLIGIGNPNFRDDGVGFWVVIALEKEVKAVHFLSPTLNMLNHMFGCEKAVIVDGVKLGRRPGEIVEFFIEPSGNSENYFGGLTHSLSLKEVIATGYLTFKEDMPQYIKFIGVEVEDIQMFKPSLSEPVKKTLPHVVEKVRNFLST